MFWYIFFAVLFLLAVLPLGVSAQYDEAGVVVRILAGPLKIQVFPMKKREKKPKTAQKPGVSKPKLKKKPGVSKPEPVNTVPKGGSWRDLLPLVQVGLDFLQDLRLKLRVNHLKLHMTMAADDPCDLAVNYGRMNAAVAGLLGRLEGFLVIKRRDVHIGCDFTADATILVARLDVTITLGRIVTIGVRYGIRALTTYLNIQKQQEGGANL